ncbi:TPA: hypothetical protein TZW69_001871 [Streptococcus suis]|uniref:Uncharacterized protein n=1 Tax=Streptococcus suis TaxID=1307 RepID=A0A0Z8HLV7_STRSU|nr:hypothetical protein [Streptococcus suis]MCQ8786298.1 hypothetical protein [Streptococcus suis]NQH41560.1 hypothetical protein [Streptococcus suis]NQH56754.1 hypothetical protein [Streptococcus suis]NQN64449.1 hypothetical protein [Streptococcus suis]NQO53176.1 hypothetical protein [Streptococcus suis]
MSFNGIRLLPEYGCKIEIDVVQLLKENEFLKDELYNRAYKDIERQEIEIESLKDKCFDPMLQNDDYLWDEMTRETAKKRANTRKWRAK